MEILRFRNWQRIEVKRNVKSQMEFLNKYSSTSAGPLDDIKLY